MDWQKETSVPALAEREIHIWRAGLEIDEPQTRAFRAYLSEDERQRAERFHFERDQRRFIAARGTLRHLIGNYLSIKPQNLVFCYGQFGKPALEPQGEMRIPNFNLSHSGELAVFAISWRHDLGIDIERLRADYGGEDIARRFFSSGEVRRLLRLAPPARPRGFYNAWTRKEAMLKARGEGIGSARLQNFDVSLEPDAPAQFLRGIEPGWHILDFEADPDTPGALVYRGLRAKVRFLSFG